MNRQDGAQLPIGQTQIDGEEIEFVWARDTSFITAEFAVKNPRGIANLTGLRTGHPHVVPLAHRTWLNPARTAALIEAGRMHFEKALQEPGIEREDRNEIAESLFTQARDLTRTR